MSEFPLQFYEFKHIDHTRRCSKYTDILGRASSEAVEPQELDALHTDLETLQGAANVRLRQLESELKVLIEWCEKKDRKGGLERELEFLSQLSAKRGISPDAEEKGCKRQKTEDKGGSSKVKGKPSQRNTEANGEPEMYVSKPKITYDTPNKFWASVEPYCADITVEDLNVLENIIKIVEDDDLDHIPPLGKHYSQRWAEEDLAEEQKEGCKAEKRRSGSVLGSNSENVGNNKDLPVPDTKCIHIAEETCPFGPFTQRLMSALVDENILAPINEQDMTDFGKAVDDPEYVRSVGNKPFSAHNSRTLENTVKEELHQLGLIDNLSDDDCEYDAEDEVLMELKRHQSELRALTAQNRDRVERLLKLAHVEMQKQELTQRAKVIDAEVVDIFRRITAAKQKKKTLTKKHRDTAWKALREREAILKLIDSAGR